MPKSKWTIRIQVIEDHQGRDKDLVGLWCGELLRYAGISKRVNGSNIDFTLGEGTQNWAEMNAARMRSFGLRAIPQEVK